MDSLSVGISILCCGGKGPSYPVADCQWCALPILSSLITIARNSDHDRLEIVITILWNE
jgi:hypothetical protein